MLLVSVWLQITNVFLSRPPSNDGEDSCDDNEDLEDSHTEVDTPNLFSRQQSRPSTALAPGNAKNAGV